MDRQRQRAGTQEMVLTSAAALGAVGKTPWEALTHRPYRSTARKAGIRAGVRRNGHGRGGVGPCGRHEGT